MDGLTENSEKLPSEILVILLSCRVRLSLHTHFSVRDNPHYRTYFIYAENYGEFEGRVFSDQVSKPEGPHNTTAALSAN
jgi:hypothetical protein